VAIGLYDAPRRLRDQDHHRCERQLVHGLPRAWSWVAALDAAAMVCFSDRSKRRASLR
jgi:hypothetical protein